ncbi:MAG: TonB-dependent receptor plug domain-containing protein, partial [Methylococcaceae bacterium]
MKYNLAGDFSDGISRQHNLTHAVSHKNKLSVCVAAAFVAGASMMTFDDVEAADGKRKSKHKTHKVSAVDQLQAENARLREQVEQLLAAQRGGVAAAPGAVPEPGSAIPGAAVTEPAEAVAKEEVEQTKDLGEVVVSARRTPSRLERLQNVPSSSSLVTGQQLNRQLAQDMQSILQRSGNAKWNPGNSRTSSISIRGVGTQAQTDAMVPSVGTAIDGVPYA